VIEFRGAEGKLDRVKGLISELVHLNVDILVIPLRAAILAARDATKTTPIVMVAGIDPVADGLATTLRDRAATSRGSVRLAES
jgi:ABC-type uncharacterized transport system substrate-binding protein